MSDSTAKHPMSSPDDLNIEFRNLRECLELAIQNSLATCMKTLTDHVTQHSPQGSFQHPPLPQHHQQQAAPPQPNHLSRAIKLKTPMFAGINPAGWIFQIQEFFDFHAMEEENRLKIVALHMEGDALEWYRYMKANNLFTNWQDFLDKVSRRFGPSQFEDAQAKLFKLMQTGSLSEFLAQFEKLVNKVTGCSEAQLLSCFIGGLSPNISRDVQLAKPTDLLEAIDLAKEFDARTEELKHDRPTANRSRRTNTIQVVPDPKPTEPNHPTPGTTLAKPDLDKKPIAFRKLNWKEQQERRAKGLCFNCDEKYTPAHATTCKAKFLMFVCDGDDTVDYKQVDSPYCFDTNAHNLVIPGQIMETHAAAEIYHAERYLSNGDYYTGQWSDNLPHGFGKYWWTDGCVYVGDWFRGQIMGKGTFSRPSGAVYEGEFMSGYMDGEGTYTGPSGDCYKGSWIMNLEHGHGAKEYTNGDCYDGEWCRGLQEGNGKYTWANGNYYVGEWKNGMISGKGKLVWSNGNSYHGEWDDGLPKGLGMFQWADGSFYVGNWSKDPKEQNGTYYPAGSSTEGIIEWDQQEVYEVDLKDCKISPPEKVPFCHHKKTLQSFLP